MRNEPEALGAAVAREQGFERTGGDALGRKIPELGYVGEVIGVAEVQQQAFVRLALVGNDGGVVEAEFFEVGENDKEDLLGIPGVFFGLHDVAGVIESFGWGLGFYEEFSLTA